MRRLLLLTLWLCASVLPRAVGQEGTPVPWVADQEVIEELREAPQTDDERADRLIELFQQAGLTEVHKQEVQRLGPPAAKPDAGPFNVIALLPGKSETRIVVGAHTDFSKVGMGIIDDWSGAALLANLAQTLKPLPRNHTFVFVGFTLEEARMAGSRDYVRRLSPEERKKIRAMVNLECLGVSQTYVWRTGSADALEALASRVASEQEVDVTIRDLFGVGADSDNFMAARIPAITFDSLSREDFQLIDSPKDRFSAINHDIYLKQYRFLVHYLLALDRLKGPVDPANKDRPHRRPPGFAPDMNRLRTEGVIVVAQVFQGSPEHLAGLQPGDTIVKFGGVVIASREDFVARFVRIRMGDKVTATVNRDGEEVELEIHY